MDEAGELAAFLAEVAALDGPNTSSAPPDTFHLGSAEEQVRRLTTKSQFYSAWDVLQLFPGTEIARVKQQYRKLSALVHPDKCRLPEAAEAFLALKQAYDHLQDPQYTDHFAKVAKQARLLVTQFRVAENKLLPPDAALPLDGPDFEAAVREECELLLHKEREAQEYADATRRANEQFLADLQRQAELDAQKCDEAREVWEGGLGDRVAGWRAFKQKQPNAVKKHISKSSRSYC